MTPDFIFAAGKLQDAAECSKPDVTHKDNYLA